VQETKLEKILIKPVEAAAMLSVSRSKIYELMQTGALPFVVIGSVKRISMRTIILIAEKKAEES
jgi:excisionase family DNA binding protein